MRRHRAGEPHLPRSPPWAAAAGYFHPLDTAAFTCRPLAAGLPELLYGPVTLDPRTLAAGAIELTRGPGGSIAGHVTRRDRPYTAGTLVGISRGDGTLLTCYVDDEGNYRFDGIAAGDWQVRTLRPGAENLRFDSTVHEVHPSGFGQVVWDVQVRDGETARFDLTVGGQTPPRAR